MYYSLLPIFLFCLQFESILNQWLFWFPSPISFSDDLLICSRLVQLNVVVVDHQFFFLLGRCPTHCHFSDFIPWTTFIDWIFCYSIILGIFSLFLAYNVPLPFGRLGIRYSFMNSRISELKIMEFFPNADHPSLILQLISELSEPESCINCPKYTSF